MATGGSGDQPKPGLVRAYGMFWDRKEVDWWGDKSDGRLELYGRVNKNVNALKVANFWDQRGIYVLYNDHGPYYVGKTFDQALGVRLRQHLKESSTHRTSWTRFSWFGWRRVLKQTDSRGCRGLGAVPQKLLTDTRSSVGDIEALLIESLGTRWVGNRRTETFASAVRWTQINRDEQDAYLKKVKK